MAKNNLAEIEAYGIEMISAIHKGNCDRGFYDEAPKTQEERAKNEDWLARQANLISGEICEAYEAFRAAKIKPDIDAIIDLKLAYIAFTSYDPLMAEKHKAEYKAAYEKYAKGTVEEELADALIRVLDHCGALGISASSLSQLEDAMVSVTQGLSDISIHKLFNDTMGQMLSYRDAGNDTMSQILSYRDAGNRMANFLFWTAYDMKLNIIFIAELADRFGISLMAAVHQKLAYNSTRPYKHGKKF